MVIAAKEKRIEVEEAVMVTEERIAVTSVVKEITWLVIVQSHTVISMGRRSIEPGIAVH